MPTVTAVIGTLLPPVIPSGDEIYDLLMGQIEPELMTDQLPLFEQRCARETKKELRARAERYKQAFDEYDKRFSAYIAMLREQEESYRHIVISRLEEEQRDVEDTAIHGLESRIAVS